MPKVRLRNGLHIYYEIADFVDPWLEPETVFLHHGLNKTGRYWLSWVRLLARHYRVVTVDMLGNGRSSRPRGYRWSIAGYARDAVEVLNALGLKRVHFVGEAVGGCVGLQLGARHGSRLLTLTLLSSPYRRGAVGLEAKSREIAERGLEAWADRTLRTRLDWDRHPPEMYAWFLKQMLDGSNRIMSEQQAAQSKEDLRWTLSLITVPTLLFIPDESPTGANTQMREMAAEIPNATVAVLPPGRHAVWQHFSEPEDCVAAFLAFQAGQRGEGSAAGPAARP